MQAAVGPAQQQLWQQQAGSCQRMPAACFSSNTSNSHQTCSSMANSSSSRCLAAPVAVVAVQG